MLKDVLKDKRFELVFFIVLLWIVFGGLSTYFKVSLNDMSAYFLSLTGFVVTYIWGESKRESEETSIFNGGPNSKRQIIIYATVLLWTIMGVFGMYQKINLVELSTYFATLTPFVGGYIMGATLKTTNSKVEVKTEIKQELPVEQLNS